MCAHVSRCFGGTARVLAVEDLAGDASTRRYARLRLSGASAPPTAVAMLLADRGVALSSEELTVFDRPSDELPYLNVHRFLVRVGVAVPELYLDASREGLLLLEDVGDLPLRDAVAGQPDARVEELFRQAIDQLLLLQIDGTAARDDACIAFGQHFDERLFLWEFEHFLEYGLSSGAGVKVRNEDRARLRRYFAAQARELGACPRVLNHRDFHAWNLFVHDGRVRVIDFQDALLAPVPYDLATLLGDRDTRQVIHPGLERALLAYYCAAWEGHSDRVGDGAELRRIYEMCALQKAFKVVGRFRYLALVKNKPAYLRYLPPTLAQIGRLLRGPGERDGVRAVLGRYFEELRT